MIPLRGGATWVAAVAMSLAVACGDAGHLPPWRAAHPDPTPGVAFADATGICALQVRDADAAPGLITVDGDVFVQTATVSAASGATVIARSNGWTLQRVSASQLVLVTGSTAFAYERRTAC